MPDYVPHRYGSSLVDIARWLTQPGEPFGDAFEDYREQWFGTARDACAAAVGDSRPDLLARIELICLESFLGVDYEDLGNCCDTFLDERAGLVSEGEARYLDQMCGTPPSLYEIQDVLPKSHLVLRDMVRKGPPVTVMEYSATKTLVRGEAIFGRLIEMDGIHLLTGGFLDFPPGLRMEVLEEIESLAKSARRKVPKKRRKDREVRAVCENFALEKATPIAVAIWVRRIVRSTKRPDLRNTDDHEIVIIEDRYEITGDLDAVVQILDRDEQNLRIEENRWDWFGEPATNREGKSVRAALGIEGTVLQAIVNSRERAEMLRDRMSSGLGSLLGKPVSTETSLAEMMERQSAERPREPQFTPEEQVQVDAQLEKYKKAHYMETLDLPVPMLGNRSPREAARTENGRREVIEWIRCLEHGERTTSPVRQFDFGWMWDELGLAEFR